MNNLEESLQQEDKNTVAFVNKECYKCKKSWICIKMLQGTFKPSNCSDFVEG